MSTAASCGSRLSKWLGEASDCGQLPRRVSRLTMLAVKLARECCTPLVYSCPMRFRGRLDTNSTFRDHTIHSPKKNSGWRPGRDPE